MDRLYNEVVEAPQVIPRKEHDRHSRERERRTHLKKLLENPNTDSFTRQLARRMLKDQNNIILIHGATGAGKSNVGEVMARILDPFFSVDDIHYDPSDFMAGVDTGEKFKCLILDEAGLGADNRRFQKPTNQVIRYALQTQRYLNQTYIFIFPRLDMLDKSLKLLCHATIWCSKPGWCSIKKIEVIEKDILGHKFEKQECFYSSSGDRHHLWRVPKVDTAFWKEYERKKDEFNKKLRGELRSQFSEFGSKIEPNHA